MNKKTYIYLRVSTSHQDTSSQRADLMTYCQSHGWEPIIVEDVITGKKFNRVGLQRILDDVRANLVARVIAFKLDRLGRSVVHLSAVCKEMMDRGVDIIVPSQGIDTSSANAAGRFQMNVLMAVAQFEREIIVERVVAGVRAKQAEGFRFGSKPKTTPKRVRELRAEGRSWRAVAKQLGITFRTAQKYAAMTTDIAP